MTAAGPGASPAVSPHPDAGPREYALIQRTRDYAPWRPLAGILIGAVGMVLILPIVLLPVLAIGVAIQGGPFGAGMTQALNLTKVTPAAMLYVNLTLAALVPLAMLLERALHGLGPRWLVSVRPGVRWRFLAACAGAAVVAMLAQFLVGAVVPAGDSAVGHPSWNATKVALAIVVLLTTPLQALGEEFAFRGYLTQACGALTSGWFADERTGRRVGTWCAVLVPATLFALAHGTQNVPLFIDRFAFGITAGVLVVVSGGIEAGVALHVMNNLAAFGIAIAFGDITQSLTVSSASWWQLVLTAAQDGVFLVLALWIVRRMRLSPRTAPTG